MTRITSTSGHKDRVHLLVPGGPACTGPHADMTATVPGMFYAVDDDGHPRPEWVSCWECRALMAAGDPEVTPFTGG